jgi:hypothetical protein
MRTNKVNIRQREILPHEHPLTGPHRPAGRRAALAELHEVRELLKYPSPALASPRMRRRYEDAVRIAALYRDEE